MTLTLADHAARAHTAHTGSVTQVIATILAATTTEHPGGYDRVETFAGSTYYTLDGLPHREGGPAIINANGEHWYLNGLRHRLDGPAIIAADGTESWYRAGVRSPNGAA